MPARWHLQSHNGQTWVHAKAKGPFGVQPDRLNRVELEPVTARKSRIDALLRPGFSAGVHEWILHGTR